MVGDGLIYHDENAPVISGRYLFVDHVCPRFLTEPKGEKAAILFGQHDPDCFHCEQDCRYFDIECLPMLTVFTSPESDQKSTFRAVAKSIIFALSAGWLHVAL